MELLKRPKSLFIICPECHIEKLIEHEYGENIIFLSALGGEYQFGSMDDYEEVLQLISCENIDHLYIVNACNCSFIENVTSGKKFKNTLVEETLNDLYFEHIEDFLKIEDSKEKTRILVNLFFETQGRKLLSTPFLGHKIESGELKCDGIFIDDNKNLNVITIH